MHFAPASCSGLSGNASRSFRRLASCATAWLAFSVFTPVLASAATASSTARVEPRLLAPANAVSVWIDPASGRVSAVVRQGSRLAVMIDGETGPRFDRLLAASGQPMLGREQFPRGTRDGQDHPVIFSHDGSRCGYIGLQGEEYVVMVDGEEVFRAPYVRNAVLSEPRTLSFSPRGKHFWFAAARPDQPQQGGTYYLWLNGKLVDAPLLRDGGGVPVFNADESRYAVATTAQADLAAPERLIIDGKPAKYAGFRPLFLPNGKLLTQVQQGSLTVYLVDGRPLHAGEFVSRLSIAADGSWAGGVKEVAILNGKPLAGTEGADYVYFSPDGKRIAVHGDAGPGQQWLSLNGKRTELYQSFVNLRVAPSSDPVYTLFTPDSTHAIAVAVNGGLRFPLIDGAESFGYEYIHDIVFAETGPSYGFVGTNDSRQPVAFINGKLYSSPEWRVGAGTRYPTIDSKSLQFSADGTYHYFWVSGGENPTHYLNGEPVDLGALVAVPWVNSPIAGPEVIHAAFSPDGKRWSLVGHDKSQRNGPYVIFVDGKPLVALTSTVRHAPAFSPDNRHLVWASYERVERPNGRPGMDWVIYHNGQPALSLDYQTPLGAALYKQGGIWKMGDDNTYRIVAATADGIVRYDLDLTAAPDLDARLSAAATAGQ